MFTVAAFACCCIFAVNINTALSVEATQDWPWDPVAQPQQIVYCDANARFTILSILGVRAEYGPPFEDRPTFAFGNRQLQGSPKATVNNATEWCNITVQEPGYPNLTVAYNKNNNRRATVSGLSASVSANSFGDHQLTVSNTDGVIYSDPQPPTHNFGGTVYQLDGVNGSIPLTCNGSQLTSNPSCTLGMLSMTGWAVYNDGKNNVYDQDWWGRSVHAVNEKQGSQDLYLFVYGERYREALELLTFLAGRQPLPPRRFFGVWWSKYFKYSQTDLRHIIYEYESNSIPLDGINLDTEWHRNTNWLDPDCKENWYSGQFDWDTSLYPDPMKMVAWLESLGLWPVWFDIHQDSGVLPSNSAFDSFVKKMGLPEGFNETVKPNVGNATFMSAFFDLLDEQVGGTNYWWLDNGLPPAVPLAPYPLSELNSFFWDHYLFYKDAETRGKLGRPTVMGPYTGLGSQRYPFVHSGDTITSWATLEFVIYYTSTASNVLLGLITHDIGGHRDYSVDGNNPELYTRFVQYGVFSAMMRPHPAKMPTSASPDKTFIRRIWEYPYEEFQEMRERMRLRARMVPYIYTINMQTFFTGIPFLRGMYVDFPAMGPVLEIPSVYQTMYLFGDHFVVAPPFRPMMRGNVTLVDVILPSLPSSSKTNLWVGFESGSCFVGGTNFTMNVTLTEFPAFVKSGSILPFSRTPTTSQSTVEAANRRGDPSLLSFLDPPVIGAARQLPTTIVWEVFLGNATEGSGVLIEDDGHTTAYQSGEYSTTTSKYTVSGSTIELTVDAMTGSFTDMPLTREYQWKIHNVLAPVNVTQSTHLLVPGRAAQKVFLTDSTTSWEWDAATLTATVYTPQISVHQSATITVSFQSPDDLMSELLCPSSRSYPFPQLHKRIQYVKRAVDSEIKKGTQPSMHLNRVEESADVMKNNPSEAAQVLARYWNTLKEAINLHLQNPHGGSPELKQLMEAWFQQDN